MIVIKPGAMTQVIANSYATRCLLLMLAITSICAPVSVAKNLLHSSNRQAKEKLELGELLNYNGNPAGAVLALKEAVRLDPDFLQAYIGLADIYDRLGRTNDRITVLQQIARLQPGDDVESELANCLISERRYAEAVAQLRKALPVARQPVNLKVLLAFALLDNGEFEESLHTFEELPQPQNESNILLGQALCNFKLGRNRDAENLVEKAISTHSPNPEAHCLRGDLRYSEGDTQAAIDEYQKAMTEAPTSSQAFQSLGFLYMQEGDVDRARQALTQANKLKPCDSEILYGLALALEKQGACDESAKVYEEALKYEKNQVKRSLIRSHVRGLLPTSTQPDANRLK